MWRIVCILSFYQKVTIRTLKHAFERMIQVKGNHANRFWRKLQIIDQTFSEESLLNLCNLLPKRNLLSYNSRNLSSTLRVGSEWQFLPFSSNFIQDNWCSPALYDYWQVKIALLVSFSPALGAKENIERGKDDRDKQFVTVTYIPSIYLNTVSPMGVNHVDLLWSLCTLYSPQISILMPYLD